ncbi:BQ5605_C004g02653 [Microbotryum silenes-dioicae]|uniref:BQ5605_C004g02653 protein n=1 Tax=Microbotryum silenes-dioicae TaxID=796604 RepID=A0A2X0M8G7_9BASI|nr:BQ5605_C004g02653 [Microbotryum silenes-dioicae]
MAPDTDRLQRRALRAITEADFKGAKGISFPNFLMANGVRHLHYLYFPSCSPLSDGRGSCNPDWVPLPPDTNEDVTEKFDLPLTVQTITAHESLILTTWRAIPMDTRAALCPSSERFAKGWPIKHAMEATLSNARKTWESRHLQELASMMHVTSLPLLARLVRTKRQEELGEPGLDSSDSGAESEDDDDEEPLDQATRAALLDEMMYH